MRYMLDTNICSYIMRNQPELLLATLESKYMDGAEICICATTYAELRFGAIGKKVKAKHAALVDAFIERIEYVLPWDRKSVEATTAIKKHLSDSGQLIGNNDMAIAGTAIAFDCTLITNNMREFERVPTLKLENWVK